MLSRSVRNKITFLITMMLPVFTGTFAQQAAQATVKPTQGYNQLSILLMIMIVVLAFVIWGMGQVLIALGRQIVDKSKNSSQVFSVVLVLGLCLLSPSSFAQEDTITRTVPNYGGLSATAFYMLMTIIATELVVILFLAFSIRRMYTELLPVKIKPAPASSRFRNWWSGLDKKMITRAVAVEKEADILLDHNYDGIRELDNALPPWWKYGFYITIGIALVYLLNFHVFGLGKNPTEEYSTEMENARIEKEIFDASNKDKIDEKNVPMADANGIMAGQQMFESNCAACHLKDGGGSVGPNLTDAYWIHKGSLNDIYHTIKTGYPDKGMQAWISKFNPKEISQLASYIKTLQGTKPADAKLPEGDLYIETTDTAQVIKTDSATQIK
jgi:cytochrome c oxidase cbb3-type subunit III